MKNINININKSVLYGIIGLFVGVIITSGFFMMNHHRGGDKKDYSHKMMMHKMPDGTMMDNMGLEGKTGEEFDKAFLSEMIVHHQGAVEMAQMVLVTSKRPELTKLANEIITAQTKEITLMREWQKQWFK